MRNYLPIIALLCLFTFITGCGEGIIRKGDELEIHLITAKRWVENSPTYIGLQLRLKRNSIQRLVSMNEASKLPEIIALVSYHNDFGPLDSPLEIPFVKDC